jgi:TM2 domain-containing membrane protein YozV
VRESRVSFGFTEHLVCFLEQSLHGLRRGSGRFAVGFAGSNSNVVANAWIGVPFVELWIHVAKLLRAHGGCLGVRSL